MVLPAGGQVDTSDPDAWEFPVGTKFFKEFVRDGVRVETRLNQRNADGWAAASYLWNEDAGDAQRLTDAVTDATGTQHDVPSAQECLACHGGRGNFSLGFSATQLPVAVRAELFDDGVLTAAVTTDLQLDAPAREGLGTLHGNCAHCHNGERDAQEQSTTCYAPPVEDDDPPLNFTLPSDLSAVEDAPILQTGRFQLGRVGDSQVLTRMSTRILNGEEPSMPPLGTELVDDTGVAAVEAFIAALPAEQRD